MEVRTKQVRVSIINVSESTSYLANVQWLHSVIVDAVPTIDSCTRRGQRVGSLWSSWFNVSIPCRFSGPQILQNLMYEGRYVTGYCNERPTN